MVASLLSTIIIFSALSLLDNTTKAERGAQARYDVAISLRQSIMQTTKLVRQATAVNTTSTQTLLDIQTFVAGSPARVVYDVSGTDFRWTLCPSANFAFTQPCGGTASVIATRVSPPQVFCYINAVGGCDSSPPTASKSVRVTLSATPDVQAGSGSITLSSDVELRNVH